MMPLHQELMLPSFMCSLSVAYPRWGDMPESYVRDVENAQRKRYDLRAVGMRIRG